VLWLKCRLGGYPALGPAHPMPAASREWLQQWAAMDLWQSLELAGPGSRDVGQPAALVGAMLGPWSPNTEESRYNSAAEAAAKILAR